VLSSTVFWHADGGLEGTRRQECLRCKPCNKIYVRAVRLLAGVRKRALSYLRKTARISAGVRCGMAFTRSPYPVRFSAASGGNSVRTA